MSIFVIFLVVELGWLVGGAYASHGNPLARFTAWSVVASTMAALSGRGACVNSPPQTEVP